MGVGTLVPMGSAHIRAQTWLHDTDDSSSRRQEDPGTQGTSSEGAVITEKPRGRGVGRLGPSRHPSPDRARPEHRGAGETSWYRRLVSRLLRAKCGQHASAVGLCCGSPSPSIRHPSPSKVVRSIARRVRPRRPASRSREPHARAMRGASRCWGHRADRPLHRIRPGRLSGELRLRRRSRDLSDLRCHGRQDLGCRGLRGRPHRRGHERGVECPRTRARPSDRRPRRAHCRRTTSILSRGPEGRAST